MSRKMDPRAARENERKLAALRKLFAADRAAELKAQREAQEKRTARIASGKPVSYVL